MHVTLRQLQVFQEVARHLSYTLAAQKLHLSQPAVSMQIKQLEGNLGIGLFDQVGKKLHLTEAGKEMYHYSRSIFLQLSEAEAVIEGLKGLHRGRLEISVASTANAFATYMLAKFNSMYGGVTVSLDVTNRAGLLEHLAENQKDLVIMGRPPADARVIAEPFADNPLVVIAPPGHALADCKDISLQALQNERFVVREAGSGTRIAMERFFQKHGFKVKTDMEMNTNESIKQSVQAGLGLGIVSAHTLGLELEVKKLVILDVRGFPVMRHWYVVYREGVRLPPVAATFRNFVLHEGRQMVPDYQHYIEVMGHVQAANNLVK